MRKPLKAWFMTCGSLWFGATKCTNSEFSQLSLFFSKTRAIHFCRNTLGYLDDDSKLNQNDVLNSCKRIQKTHSMQTCHFDLIQNLNECQKKSEYSEKNLNLTTKVVLLYRNLYPIFQSQKNLNFESVYLNFTKFQEKNLNEWQVCSILLSMTATYRVGVPIRKQQIGQI